MDLNRVLASNVLGESGSTDEVRRALLRGADPNMVVYSADDSAPIPILWAVVSSGVMTDRNAKAQLLLEAGARVMDRLFGLPLLHVACDHGYSSIARMLVSHGAAVNDKTDGLTPLHIASMNGHNDLCLFLLQNGAGVDMKTTDGATALHFAAGSGHAETAQVLLENGGARASETDSDGMTPMHCAAISDSEGVARLLLDHGADVNAKDNHDETPLDTSIRVGRRAVTSVLMEAHGQKLLAHGNVHPALWAHVLAKVGERSTDMSRVGIVYSLLGEKPDLFNYRNAGRKRKRPDRFVPGV